MRIEKRPSGSYRVRKQINNRTITLTFDHKPTQQEVLKALSIEADSVPVKDSFEMCANSYIDSKRNVLSPSTIYGYNSIIKNLPKAFLRKELSQITQIDIQVLINDFAKDHTPKSVRNIHGFISAVLRQFRPDMVIRTTLPQKIPYEGYIPNEEDITKLLNASVGTRYHIPFQLGIMGLRRSEILALTLDDIDPVEKTLTINKAKVRNENNEWVVKTTKTTSGIRTIYIPDPLIEEIMGTGTIYDGYPNRLYTALCSFQDKLNLPHFRFHALRHFFASYSHMMGMSDADIMASGGWKSDSVMKNLYRHEMREREMQEVVFNSLLSSGQQF